MRGMKKTILFFTVVLGLAGCGGLVKLNIHQQDFQNPAALWLTSGKNNLRHYASPEDVLPPYGVLWEIKYKSVIADHPLVVGNYLLFTTVSGRLALIDWEKGMLLGDGNIAPGVLHGPTLHNWTLFYGANLGRETAGALDLTTLKHQWKVYLAHINTNPLFWKEKIYLGADNGDFYCLDSASGKQRWKFTARSSILGSPAQFNQYLVFADLKGWVYCLDATSGAMVWETKLGDSFYAGPLVAEGNVLIGNTNGFFYCLNLGDGSLRWKFKTAGAIFGHAAYRNGFVYFGNNDHFLFSLNVSRGDLNWKFQAQGIINTAPLAGPDFVYFGSWDRYFYVLDRITGKLIYRRQFDRPFKSTPIIYRNRLFIHTANSRLYCLVNETMIEKLKKKK